MNCERKLNIFDDALVASRNRNIDDTAINHRCVAAMPASGVCGTGGGTPNILRATCVTQFTDYEFEMMTLPLLLLLLDTCMRQQRHRRLPTHTTFWFRLRNGRAAALLCDWATHRATTCCTLIRKLVFLRCLRVAFVLAELRGGYYAHLEAARAATHRNGSMRRCVCVCSIKPHIHAHVPAAHISHISQIDRNKN